MDQRTICAACGTRFPTDIPLPALCPICADDRQFIPESGQSWTTTAEITAKHNTVTRALYPFLHEIKLTPAFAIGQRAFLVTTPGGNILWDCIPLLEQQTIDFIKSKGGLKAIIISHPHYYSNMREWATVFDCPVWIHAYDAEWIMDKGDHIELWTGVEKLCWNGTRVIKTGGHFAGSCILHIAAPTGEQIILAGDSLQIARSRRHIGIMYSYPNIIPLPLHKIEGIKQQVLEIEFDGMYGAFEFQNLPEGARDIFIESMKKYIP